MFFFFLESRQLPADNLGMWDQALKKSRAATEMTQITLRRWREVSERGEVREVSRRIKSSDASLGHCSGSGTGSS